MSILRLALAQINCTVGDLQGNVNKMCLYLDEARKSGADLVAFPELAVTGYPPEDLLFKPHFINDNRKHLHKLAQYCCGLTVVVGFVDSQDGLHNAAAIINDGKVVGIYRKMLLPNYGVFDEHRYFRPGTKCPVWIIKGIAVGVNICEDIWYLDGPATAQAEAGAKVMLNISSSPYHMGKRQERLNMLSARASGNRVAICYVNMVGGQDELIFDGDSMVTDTQGELLAEGKQFEEDLIVTDINVENGFQHDPQDKTQRRHPRASQRQLTPTLIVSSISQQAKKPILPSKHESVLEPAAEVYSALVLGTRDYMRKNGFGKAVIGLSGGIDSSIVATIAVDAIGKNNVVGVLMPSTYSSESSISDARLLAGNLGLTCYDIPISGTFCAYLDEMAPAFKGTDFGIAEENLQARTRGNILMALSNKFNWLVLTTGNKSEMATGYCTLYGDMAGGFAVIKDVTKTLVYELSRHRNKIAGSDTIPKTVIEKEPSAELRHEQKDSDSLPLYEILDPILNAYVEKDKNVSQIVAMGFNRKMVQRVITMVDRNEYKRRQAAPGIKITPRAFGKDRRLPITNAYRHA